MRKISGQLLSSKPVSVSTAAKLISDFAAFDNGSSATISLYLQRTADAFNHLLQFHDKNSGAHNPETAHELEKYYLNKSPDGKTVNDSKKRGKKNKRTTGANPNEDRVKDLVSEDKEEIKEDSKKLKKKRKNDGSEGESKKRRRLEGPKLQNLQV
ncbi:adenosine monophosphate-protein hydrolase SidD [Striga asiatica]|uniref:Adenosine monophosphate-protein hydrolase SidD n=1 Tax=Striga asiatica TaxID=4170 RepID=A0A5A7R367_STRAF|nr:adenosine monophosphate-protein hydrolase SidD [Striga asiatica]